MHPIRQALANLGTTMNLLRQIATVWLQYREFQAALVRYTRLPLRERSDLTDEHGSIAAAAFAAAERRTSAFAEGGDKARPPRKRKPEALGGKLASDFRG